MRVLTSTASLRARNLEKHLGWAKMLVPVVEARLNGDYAELRAQTLVQSALACFDIALSTWPNPRGWTQSISCADPSPPLPQRTWRRGDDTAAVVREGGLEPPRPETLEPKSSASANSATRASDVSLRHRRPVLNRRTGRPHP